MEYRSAIQATLGQRDVFNARGSVSARWVWQYQTQPQTCAISGEPIPAGSMAWRPLKGDAANANDRISDDSMHKLTQPPPGRGRHVSTRVLRCTVQSGEGIMCGRQRGHDGYHECGIIDTVTTVVWR